MQSLALGTFVERLRALVARPGTGALLAFMQSFRPAWADLEPFLAFDARRYARQRLHHESAFELLLLCWEPGQETPIHDHGGQRGWVSVIEGALDIQDFAVQGASGAPRPGQEVRLRPARSARLASGQALVETVTDDTVHRVAAPKGRALSLHVYAGPLESFLVFDARTGLCTETRL